MIHLHQHKLEYYQGSFDTFEAVRAEQRLRDQRRFEVQEAKKKELQKFVDKHLHKGKLLTREGAGACKTLTPYSRAVAALCMGLLAVASSGEQRQGNVCSAHTPGGVCGRQLS